MTYEEIRNAWNAQADEQNQWDELSEVEKIEWAVACAICLSSAAPEMLEALQEIVAAADGDGWSQLDPSLTKARTAIDKAHGVIHQAIPEDVEEEPDDECPHCAGTGEGQYDGQSCGMCRGKGFIRN